jgi:hypothetical protein
MRTAMKTIRQLHLCIRYSFRPVIIFYALIGAVQTLGLHEDERDGSYKAREWLGSLAEIHKNQRRSREYPPDRRAHRARHGLRSL